MIGVYRDFPTRFTFPKSHALGDKLSWRHYRLLLKLGNERSDLKSRLEEEGFEPYDFIVRLKLKEDIISPTNSDIFRTSIDAVQMRCKLNQTSGEKKGR